MNLEGKGFFRFAGHSSSARDARQEELKVQDSKYQTGVEVALKR